MFASPGGRNSGPSLGRSLFLGAYGTHESTHRGPTFTAARGYPECTELGGLTLPRCHVRRGGQGKALRLSPLLAQTTRTSQTGYSMATASRVQPRRVGRNYTTDSWKTSFGEGRGKSPLSPLVLTSGCFPLPQTIPGLGHIEAGCPREQEIGSSAGPRSQRL